MRGSWTSGVARAGWSKPQDRRHLSHIWSCWVLGCYHHSRGVGREARITDTSRLERPQLRTNLHCCPVTCGHGCLCGWKESCASSAVTTRFLEAAGSLSNSEKCPTLDTFSSGLRSPGIISKHGGFRAPDGDSARIWEILLEVRDAVELMGHLGTPLG